MYISAFTFHCQFSTTYSLKWKGFDETLSARIQPQVIDSIEACQVNEIKWLVQVPPDIMDESSTSDVTIKEGDNVTLMCRATGKPTPRIIWRREDGQRIVLHKSPLGASHQAKARHESANSAVQSLEPSVSELYGNSQVHQQRKRKQQHATTKSLVRLTGEV